MDRVRTSLLLVNVNFNGFTPDWWLLILGLMSVGIAVGMEPTTPGYWPFAVGGALVLPYIVYIPVSLVCHRPHFFTASSESRIEPGCYAGRAFGYWSFDYEVRAFVGPKVSMKTYDAYFAWSCGSIEFDGERVRYDLSARASVFCYRHNGVMEQPLQGEFPAADIEFGEATVLWRRVPAIKVRAERHGFIVAITGEAQPEAPQDGESAGATSPPVS